MSELLKFNFVLFTLYTVGAFALVSVFAWLTAEGLRQAQRVKQQKPPLDDTGEELNDSGALKLWLTVSAVSGGATALCLLTGLVYLVKTLTSIKLPF